MLAFDPTDKARIEVAVLNGNDLRAGTGRGPFQWPTPVWPMVDDFFAIDDQRLERVELEPGQDIRRSIIFHLPSEWELVRVSCHLWHGGGAGARKWVTTKTIVKEPDIDAPSLSGQGDML